MNTANTVKKKKERIFYLDQLRTLAIILVILAHVIRKFCESNPINSVSWNITIPFMPLAVMGVPIFLMISGVLLLNRDYDLDDFLKRRFTRILLPFFFWGLLLPIHKMIWIGQEWNLHNYYSLFIDGQYWFVWMLIGVYLAIPIINSFIQKYQMKGIEYFLLIWAIVMILNAFDHYPFHQLRIEYFSGYLGYLPLGYYLANKKFNLSDKYLVLIGLIICGIGIAIQLHQVIYISPVIGSIKYYKYETIITVMQSAGVFMIFRYFASYCENNKTDISNKIYGIMKYTILSKIILSLSVCSYGMFLSHYFWMYILVYLTKNGIPIFTGPAIILFPLVLVFIVFMAWLVPWIMSKIPILKEFSGAH